MGLYKTDNNNIGPWTLGDRLGNINSINLAECCDQYDWVASNTHFIPKNQNKRNLATWHSNDGQLEKQIDYVLINKRYRNWVKNVCNQHNANTSTPMQHKAVIINIQVTLKNNYFESKQDDNCPYDLQ